MKLILKNSALIMQKRNILSVTYTEDDCTIVGKGISAVDGQLKDNYVRWKSSDFKQLPSGIVSMLLSNDYIAVNFGLAFYESNDETSFISGIAFTQRNTKSDITVPQNATYIRFCVSNVDNPDWNNLEICIDYIQ